MKRLQFLLLIIFFNSILFAGEWHVKKDAGNLIKFISSTPVLDFEGVTNNIDGYLYSEGSGLLGEKNEFYFEVDLNTVSTGIGKRDRDMREDVLETDKWPKTYFKGSITNFTKTDSGGYRVIAKGIMFIHGVGKEMEIPAFIQINGKNMSVNSEFSVFLKDFNIEAPSLLAFIKVAEEIKLSIYFHLFKISGDAN